TSALARPLVPAATALGGALRRGYARASPPVTRLVPVVVGAVRGAGMGLRWREIRRSRVFAYGVPVLVTMLVTLTWVQGGSFIASGDVAPFEVENTAAELTSLWNHQLTGAGSASYAIVLVPHVVLVRLASIVGLSAATAQYLFYALIWGYAAFGGAYLAATWIRRTWAVVAAGLIAAFNAYLLVNHPNPLPALAIGMIGVLLGMTLRAGSGRRVRGTVFAAATLPASFLSQNPPLLAVLVVVVVGAAVAARAVMGRGATKRASMLLLRAAPWALLLNLWWMVPYGMTIDGLAGLELSARTDVLQWSWTHARSSLANVATLTSHWGWEYLDYYPFRPAMEQWWRSALRWALPALALGGVFLARRSHRRLAWALSALCVVSVAVGTGLHPPLGPMNRWLYDHVPGMWLLRDPAMKLSVVLVLCYGTLAAIAIDRMLAFRGRPTTNRIMRLGVGLLAVAAVGYPWPLWTGAVVPDKKPVLPSSHVRIPSEWYDVAAAVDGSSAPGKVLVLPLNSYYQVTTSWGYHGTDVIPTQLMSRPVVKQLPGAYMRAAGSANALIGGVESALLAGDRPAVESGLRALGIGQVIIRDDLVVLPSAVAAPASVDALRQAADALLVRTGHYPVADVYQVPGAIGAVAAYNGLTSVVGGDPGSHEGLALTAGSVATSDRGIAGDEAVWRAGGDGTISLREEEQYKISHNAQSPIFRAEIVRKSRSSTLRMVDVGSVAVDGTELPGRPLLTESLDPRAETIAVNGRLMTAPSAGQYVRLSEQNTLTQYVPAEGAALGDFGPLGDCARTDTDDPKLALDYPNTSTIRLAAQSHAACVSAPLARQDTEAVYLVRFDHRVLSGSPARMCLWQEDLGRCLDTPDLAVGEGWLTDQFAVRIAPEAGQVSLFLYADGDGSDRTVVDYQDIRVDPLRQLSERPLTPPPAPVADRQLSGGDHSLVVRQDVPQTTFHGPGALGNCDNVTGRLPAERGLRLENPSEGVVRLTAPVDIACVTLTAPAAIGDQYRLELGYRTVAGRAPRICLWQVGPNRCVPMPGLTESGDWTRLSTVIRSEAGTRSFELFLYADGQESPSTVVEFRNPTLIPDTGSVVRVDRAIPPTPAPTLSVVQRGVSDFRVSAEGATGRFNLVLAEAAAPGWRLDGLPRGWSAQRFTAYGYAAGWVITGHGDASLTVAYGPNRYASAARYGSLAVAVLIALWWGAGGLLRVRAHRR
ncbi:MAG: hypothetical protein HKP61_17030, partial [Dactylosporangium sp.]|nr:DUF3367 domain-containing protein [Dactylosporangium sp.]NNJ62611.1 hypothetical protein [Dactylosporangium sp.]